MRSIEDKDHNQKYKTLTNFMPQTDIKKFTQN